MGKVSLFSIETFNSVVETHVIFFDTYPHDKGLAALFKDLNCLNNVLDNNNSQNKQKKKSRTLFRITLHLAVMPFRKAALNPREDLLMSLHPEHPSHAFMGRTSVAHAA